MPTEKQAREMLILAFEHIKSQRAAISSLMAEVHALRDSLCAIAPRYADVLKQYREASIQSNAASLAEETRKIDAIIQLVHRVP